MFIEQEGGGAGGGRGGQTTPLRLLPALSVIVLLISVQGLNAATQISSGTVQLGNTFTYGTTAYSVDYHYPSTVEVGTNLTITVSLHVNSLSGLVEYITNYRINAYVYIGTQLVGNGSTTAATNTSHLYPGGSWGPNNVTIPLTEGNTGLAKGQSANATVSLILANQDHVVNGRYSVYINEPPMQGLAGTVLIQDAVPSTTITSTASNGAGGTYLPEALMISGVVFVLLAIALWPRLPRGSNDHHAQTI